MPAAIVGIAATVAGSAASVAIGGTMGALVGAIIATGIAYAGYALGIGVQKESAARGLLANYASTDSAIPVVYGQRTVGGPVIYNMCESERFTVNDRYGNGGDGFRSWWNEHLFVVVVLSEGECDTDALTNDDILFDDAPISDLKPDWLARIEWGAVSGTEDQAADPGLVGRAWSWDEDFRLLGVAYVWVRLTFDEVQFATGIPRINVRLRGKKVFDPRVGDYKEVTGWSNNPALCVLDYLLGYNPGSTYAGYGWHAAYGVTWANVDEPSFVAAANYCDQLITIGGVEQARYTCNGVLDPTLDPKDNMDALLSSCRGMLTFSGDKWKLIIDAPRATSEFAFTEDNIIGDWSIQMGSRDTLLNRVKAKFYRESMKWNPDFAIGDSPEYRVVDDGLMLEQEIDLPFASDAPTAWMMARLHLAASRQNIVVQFSATVEGTRCEVGDIVPITHSTPGWTAKLFDIKKIDLLSDGNCRIVAREYSEDAYDYESVVPWDDSPDTSLSDPLAIGPPGNVALVESLYMTRRGTGVKAKAVITWTESVEGWVSEYEVEMCQTSLGVTYRLVGRTPGTRLEVLDIAPGLWWTRIRAVSRIGVPSEYTPKLISNIYALSALPSSITGLTVTAMSGMAMLIWNKVTDLDVVIGGRVVFRHYQGATPTWTHGIDIGAGVAGSATMATLPLMQGYYMVKAQDSTGQESAVEATVYNLTPGPVPITENAASPITEEPTFTGSKTGCQVVSSCLQLNVVSGDVVPLGTYLFANSLDLGFTATIQMSTDIISSVVTTDNTIDNRTSNIDIWPSFDQGTVSGSYASVEIYVRYKATSGGAWSGWMRLPGVGDYWGRYFEIKAVLTSTNVDQNIVISQLRVRVWNY